MPVTKEMQKALANLARAANRRIERATPGQRAYMQRQIEKYHVRERQPGINVFQQGKAASAAEYHARMRELQAFMGAKSTIKKGWKAIKAAQVAEAGKTIRGQGADISDEELALVLEEISEGHKSAEFYKALANVEINKREAREEYDKAVEDAKEAGWTDEEIKKKIKWRDYWTPSAETISDAIQEKRTAQQRAELLISLRGR